MHHVVKTRLIAMGAAETFFNLEEETITTTGHSKDAFANKSCVAWQYRLARSGQFDSLLSCLTTAHDIFSPASKRPRYYFEPFVCVALFLFFHLQLPL
jgi:hypothetical protein